MTPKRLNTPIFVFEDYVDYLREWYLYAKRFGLTQKNFLKKAKINSAAFLSDVISRRKKIGKRNINGFITALELKKDEKEYFRLLVEKELCKDPKQKISIIEKLAELRKKNLSSCLENRTMEYFASWRYPVIREFIVCKGEISSPKEIVKSLINLKLSTLEVKQALSKLIKWGLIEYDSNKNVYRAVNTAALSYQDMPHPVVNDVKRTLIEASIHAMEEMPKHERHVSMTIKGISKQTYDSLSNKIDALRKEFLEIQEQPQNVDKIISLNIQLFPIMKINRSNEERAGD
jgi:uncharacterized protein (TIGR02147 family)